MNANHRLESRLFNSIGYLFEAAAALFSAFSREVIIFNVAVARICRRLSKSKSEYLSWKIQIQTNPSFF